MAPNSTVLLLLYFVCMCWGSVFQGPAETVSLGLAEHLANSYSSSQQDLHAAGLLGWWCAALTRPTEAALSVPWHQSYCIPSVKANAAQPRLTVKGHRSHVSRVFATPFNLLHGHTDRLCLLLPCRKVHHGATFHPMKGEQK